ncbi:MAG TPA: ferrochelatase [Rhodanobacteraceae bacterium]|nr:ferrochelatase [Rhodanobacteraceae bacterium]
MSEAGKVAVLLVNLGTPVAPTAAALRPYLAQFLGDPRVIDLRPRWWWKLVLHGLILRIRPRRSARAYASIWLPEGSPLRVYSERLAAALGEALASRCAPAPQVALAMTYGEPAVAATLARLHGEGVRRVLLLPLFPQYSATSTGAAIDTAADALKAMRWPPELRLVNDYHDDAGYLDALAASVRAHWQQQGRGDRLLLSFHGIPQRYVELGDPYAAQCRATAGALRHRLGLGEGELLVSFQSRVGREPWLQPYTDVTVKQLGREGVGRLDVLCPGFAVDCLETLEEIALRADADFRAAGGRELRYIPALNASPGHVEALATLALRHLGGWGCAERRGPETGDQEPGRAPAP